MRNGVRQGLFLLLLGIATAATAADPVRDFYAGRTIQLVIGYSVGGGYDLYARTLARHMSRHIPGNPIIVPQNMPGAGSVRALNYLAKAAPKDGSVFGTFARGAAMEPLLDPQSAAFDPRSLNWIGSITNEVSTCAFWHSSGIKTWQDMQKKSYTIGGTGVSSDTDVFPKALRSLFHLPLKLVTGFPGGQDVVLSLQRGEIDGRCGWSWTSLISRNRALYDSKQIFVPLQLGLKKHPDLPDVPLVTDLSDDPKVKAALRVIFSRQAMARPFAAPPGVPAERLTALREAFEATMRDPEFLDEAKKLELEVAPVSGEEITQLVTEVYATPPDIVQLAREAMADKTTP
ncbi:MAG TPA: tripartite tricarboxylate transporter substrate-binding protein [Magnetospirillaceae bacterium]|nr:tripartite tricarboxylate transporter substrate-binding protein [Magnetospirillaceae bacterium]